jgi:hypothetical protein
VTKLKKTRKGDKGVRLDVLTRFETEEKAERGYILVEDLLDSLDSRKPDCETGSDGLGRPLDGGLVRSRLRDAESSGESFVSESSFAFGDTPG